MPVRRALVGCAVLCVQEARVVYPSCSHCCSKIDPQLHHSTRYTCSRCGHGCPKAQVRHRYRLSLRVAREAAMFGVTVFGACLDPFFGIDADGLQRLMEEEEGPVEAAAREALLNQAVEDCFIGRQFLFGIKVKDTGSSPWFDGSGGVTGGGSSAAGPAQFIATQVLLPPGCGGAGCSVLRYYQALLQRAENLGGSSAGGLGAPLLLPVQSLGRAARIITTPPRPHCPLLSRSLHRLLNPDSPWQQSLGLVTSSAEQDTQKDEECNGSKPLPHPPPPNHTPAETQRAPPSTALPSANDEGFSSSSIGQSFTCPPWSPVASHMAPLHPNTSPPTPTPLSPDPWPRPQCGDEAWDDMAFSESLEAFIACQENPSDSRTVSPSSRCHGSHNRRTLADVGNMCAPSRARDATPESASRVSQGACMRGSPLACTRGSPCPLSCEPMGAQGFFVDDDNDDDDVIDEVYDCSADLFGDPMAAVTVATEEPAYTPHKHAAGGSSSSYQPTDSYDECPKRWHQTPTDDIVSHDILHAGHPEPLDFIPRSQSTPLVPTRRTRVGPGSGAVAAPHILITTSTPSRPLVGGRGQWAQRFIGSPLLHRTTRHQNQSSRRRRRLRNCRLTSRHSGEQSLPPPDTVNDSGGIRRTPSREEMSGAQTNTVDSKTCGRSPAESGIHHSDQSQEFDLSRDLFADSFH